MPMGFPTHLNCFSGGFDNDLEGAEPCVNLADFNRIIRLQLFLRDATKKNQVIAIFSNKHVVDHHNPFRCRHH